MTNIEIESRARRRLLVLAIFLKELEGFDKEIENLGLEKEELDEVRVHVEALRKKVKEWIDELGKILDAVSSETEHFTKEEIEKYVKELETYIKHSNRILQTVMSSIDLTPYLFKTGDSVVMNVADAEELIRMAILKTVDVMLSGEVEVLCVEKRRDSGRRGQMVGFKALGEKIKRRNKLKRIKLDLLNQGISEGLHYVIDEEKDELWTCFDNIVEKIAEVVGRKWDREEDKERNNRYIYTRYIWQLSKILEESDAE